MNKSKTKDNTITNIYKKIPKNLLPKYNNPNFNNHKLKVPFRIVVVGASGSGKTNVAVEIMRRMDETFNDITIITKNADEPIYNYLKTKMTPEELTILEGIESIPDLEDFDPEDQHLVIFDDLVLEKNQKKIEEYFIRGRKRNISMMYLTQSYYKTPRPIRLNSNYLILKKLASKRDLNTILSEVNIGLKKEELLKIYKDCVEGDFTNFMLIDIDAPNEEKFRKNFLDIIEIDE
jgi:hypothetical protein